MTVTSWIVRCWPLSRPIAPPAPHAPGPIVGHAHRAHRHRGHHRIVRWVTCVWLSVGGVALGIPWVLPWLAPGWWYGYGAAGELGSAISTGKPIDEPGTAFILALAIIATVATRLLVRKNDER